jgi:hypothetical protein
MAVAPRQRPYIPYQAVKAGAGAGRAGDDRIVTTRSWSGDRHASRGSSKATVTNRPERQG